MSKENNRTITGTLSEVSDWPEPLNVAFSQFIESAKEQGFGLICAVAVDHKSGEVTVHFTPMASNNLNFAQMCSDLSEMFTMMGRRTQQ